MYPMSDSSDNSYMGRSGPSALILGTTAVVVAAVGTGVALTRSEVPVAKAATTLSQVSHARVVSPNGVSAPAVEGARVPNNYVVRTTRHGSAALQTRGRTVYVGPAAAVAVINGAHQQLRTGSAVIDAQNGPGLDLDLAGDVLTVPDHSATEATRSVSVLVGSLAGPSALTNTSARRLTIPALEQALVNGDALPGSTMPLHLTHSSGETSAVPDLIDADNRLTTLAHGIDSSGPAAASVIEAGWNGVTAALPAAAHRSERVLPMVIADATTRSGVGSAEDRYSKIVSWRRAGGSWGVTLAKLAGDPAAVETTFAKLRGQSTGRVGQVSVQALGRVTVPGGGTRTHPVHQHHGSPPPPQSPPPTHGTGGRTPTPTPTASKDPVTKAVTTVDGVVTKVVHLLPVHVLPAPSPHASKTPGLLGTLLGH
jgi:hypothetical protein